MDTKTILITGATDGIGLATAKALLASGHRVLIHGRSAAKLERVRNELSGIGPQTPIAIAADLGEHDAPQRIAEAVLATGAPLDVLINNAGVFAGAGQIAYRAADGQSELQLDARFVVNTIAPYLLSLALLPQMPADGRVVNLASAAQAPVVLAALRGERELSDGEAYAQSKLALIMWTADLARQHSQLLVSVNPGSMLASKMVKEAYGVAGADIQIGADILVRAALSEEFADKTGQYYDNDNARFAPPHPAGRDPEAGTRLVAAMRAIAGA